jgi:hypothetical protein
MNNLLSYCGLVEPKISASDKDLPVKRKFVKKTSNGKEMNELESMNWPKNWENHLQKD